MKSKSVKIFNSSEYGVRIKSSKSEIVRMQKIKKLIGAGKHVLDVGCEDGEIAKILKENDNHVEGIEISKPAVRLAKKRGIKVYEMNLESEWTRKITKKYDLVFAGEVIEHIYDTDKFLENIRRVLKSSGELIITTPNLASLGRRILLFLGHNPLTEVSLSKTNAGHIRYFTFSSLEKLLDIHRFKTVYESSTVLNFDNNGKFSSVYLSGIFPAIGSTIIIKAIKI